MTRILLIITAVLLMVGCYAKAVDGIDYDSIGFHIHKMQKHMEVFSSGRGDYTQLEKDINVYNKVLLAIHTNDEKILKFVEYQLKANDLRLDGLKNMDSAKITESARFQYYATGLYEEMIMDSK